MKSLSSLCIVAALAAAAIALPAQTLTFAPMKKILPPNSTVQVIGLSLSGNFNGNGNTDLIVGDYFYTGDGTGNFAVAGTINVGNANDSLVADANGDGKDDIITVDGGCVANTCANPGSFKVFLSQGSGKFILGYTGAFPSGFSDMAGVVGDFNKDGKPDVAVVAYASGTIEPPRAPELFVFLNNGNGSFTQAAYQLPTNMFTHIGLATNVVVGDFEGNGNLDLAFATNIGGGAYGTNPVIYTLAGNGKGGFGPAVVSYTLSTYIAGETPNLFATDLNGDGRADLLVADSGVDPVKNFRVPSLLAEASGKFYWASAVYIAGQGSIALRDLNGDGKPDLIFATTTRATTVPAGIYIGLGNGAFQTPHVPLTINANSSVGGAYITAVPLKTGDLPSLIFSCQLSYLQLFINTTKR